MSGGDLENGEYTGCAHVCVCGWVGWNYKTTTVIFHTNVASSSKPHYAVLYRENERTRRNYTSTCGNKQSKTACNSCTEVYHRSYGVDTYSGFFFSREFINLWDWLTARVGWTARGRSLRCFVNGFERNAPHGIDNVRIYSPRRLQATSRVIVCVMYDACHRTARPRSTILYGDEINQPFKTITDSPEKN